MALWRAQANGHDHNHPSPELSMALCAAELGEDFDLARLQPDPLRELFDAVPRLRVAVPYATMRLLARLSTDTRVEVRTQTARALQWFVELYPERLEDLLLLLTCDPSRKVRQAAVETLSALLPRVGDPERLIETWENEHPDRAREALRSARRALPPPLGG